MTQSSSSSSSVGNIVIKVVLVREHCEIRVSMAEDPLSNLTWLHC